MVSPPAARLDEVETRYAAQVHVFPQSQTYSFFLNTRLPPFNNLAARQAVNYALDRSKAIPAFGGDEQRLSRVRSSQPACRATGRTVRIRATGQQRRLDRARSGARPQARDRVRNQGQKVLVWTGPTVRESGRSAARLAALKLLGYRASLKDCHRARRSGQRPVLRQGRRLAHARAGRLQCLARRLPRRSELLHPAFSTCPVLLPASAANENTPSSVTGIDQTIERAVTRHDGQRPRPTPGCSAVDGGNHDSAAWAPMADCQARSSSAARSARRRNPEWGVPLTRCGSGSGLVDPAARSFPASSRSALLRRAADRAAGGVDPGRAQGRALSSSAISVGFTAAFGGGPRGRAARASAPTTPACGRRSSATAARCEKFIGDAVMGVFGAPVAHEDDAERAVRAGLRDPGRDRRAERARTRRSTCRCAIGINTGEAVVALGARPEQGEAMVDRRRRQHRLAPARGGAGERDRVSARRPSGRRSASSTTSSSRRSR